MSCCLLSSPLKKIKRVNVISVTEQAIADSDDILLTIISSWMRTDANKPLLQIGYASSSTESFSSCVYIRRFFGDDWTVWCMTPLRQIIRTRPENIINRLPSVTPEAKSIMYYGTLLKVSVYTYWRIRPRIISSFCNNLREYKYINKCFMADMKVFVGLFYLGRQNLSVLRSTDDTGFS